MHVGACIGRAMEVCRRNADMRNRTDLVFCLSDHREEGYAIFFDIHFRHSGVSLYFQSCSGSGNVRSAPFPGLPMMSPKLHPGKGLAVPSLTMRFSSPAATCQETSLDAGIVSLVPLASRTMPLILTTLSGPVEISVGYDRSTPFLWGPQSTSLPDVYPVFTSNDRTTGPSTVSAITRVACGCLSGKSSARENVAMPF